MERNEKRYLKTRPTFIDFFLKEWLLIGSGISLILTSIYIKHFPSYSIQEIEVLFILFVLFVTVNGLYHSGLILKIAHKIEKGRLIAIKLVATTFFLSMFVTNDISLIVIVPLTLSLNIEHKDVLVILEALAANAGSALTPFGNPQNLYIYWFYGIHPLIFIKTIAPFSLFFMFLLSIGSFFIKTQTPVSNFVFQEINKKAYIYSIFFVLILLTVFHILPVLVSIIVVIFAFIFDQESLYVDYSLLLSFFFFFGLAENMKFILSHRINHSGHIFLFSALLSQMISNVPATLLFVKFTANWKALLWGVNTGGFGALLGSFANLIAYRIYVTREKRIDILLFTTKFLAIGYLAFFLSISLYFFIIN